MAESLGVIEIVYDNQLIAYLIRDTLTPYCAVIALGISDQKNTTIWLSDLKTARAKYSGG